MSLLKTNGDFTYALDDPYTHMALAKNFVKYGVWGVDRYSFSSATSSPLWTLLLSTLYFITGVNEYIPFILNCIIAFCTLLVFFIIIKKINTNNAFQLITQLSLIFLVPFPALIFGGMEHILHLFFLIPFVYLSLEIVTENNISIKKNSLIEKLSITFALLLCATRYEGLFTVAAVVVLLFLKKQFRLAFLILLFSLISVSIYGFISMSNGEYFLPNTLLLKGNILSEFSLKNILSLLNVYAVLKKSGLMIDLLKILIFLFVFGRMWRWSERFTICFIILAINIFLHLDFALTGAFGRYEAYLIGFGILTCAIGVDSILKSEDFKTNIRKIKIITPFYLVTFFLCLPPFLPLGKRAASLIKNIPLATKNIYEQQYQMASFLKEYYKGEVVAANDIGAINYFGDIKCLDLWGLACLDVVNLKLKNKYTSRTMHELAQKKGAKIAIVYDHWFEKYGGIPSQWELVCQWKIKDNRVCGGDIVSFYAVDPQEKERLIKNLSSFSKSLPPDVIVIPVNKQ